MENLLPKTRCCPVRASIRHGSGRWAAMTSTSPPPSIDRLVAEYRGGPRLGIGAASPRLSWTTTTTAAGWVQAAYEVEVDGASFGRVDGAESVFVTWPAAALTSRERARIRVRVWGTDGSESPWSEPLDLEAGLLAAEDWTATWLASAD